MRFDMICEANDIEHRLARPNPSWTTNAQVERMNRTSKWVTVMLRYETHHQLRVHLKGFMAAYSAR